MSSASLVEEEYYTSAEFINKLREVFTKYLGSILELDRGNNYLRTITSSRIGRIDPSRTWSPESIAVVDGGSNIIGLAAGYVGVVAAVAILIRDNTVEARLIEGPLVVPSNPSELILYESVDIVESVVNKVREALVFRLASRSLKTWNPDLLIVDGPLTPYRAFSTIVARESESEKKALSDYREAVLQLYRDSLEASSSIIGFVKRPRSTLLSPSTRVYDHVLLSRILGEREYYPSPPQQLSSRWITDNEIRSIISAMRVEYTYYRATISSLPFRVDFGTIHVDYRDILSYLYRVRTRDGVPFPVMKADEEARIAKKLLREIYYDALHYHIHRSLDGDIRYLSPILLEYGER